MVLAASALPLPPSALGIAAVSVLALLYLRSLVRWQRRSRGLPFPPGPPALPLLGNILNMPTTKIWEGFRDLNATYGDVVHLRVLGQSMVILGSAEVVFEFLEKRSAHTSSRSQSTLVELVDQTTELAFMPYGPAWRRYRRAFGQHFNPGAMPQYRQAQLTTTHALLEKILAHPDEADAHIKHTIGALTMKVLYDIDAPNADDPYLRTMHAALAASSAAFVPGRFAVEFLPVLKYAPAWFPGSGQQRVFRECRQLHKRIRTDTYEHTKRVVVKEGTSPSVVGKMIMEFGLAEKAKPNAEEEDMAKDIGTVAFKAGVDSTYAAIQSALLALSLNPTIRQKAQAELDAVVGPDRLPLFADVDALVYIRALVKEALRWHSVFPIGLPHCTTADDELNGFFIPAGTAVVANIWAYMHDPQAYESPDEFRPERFIGADGALDPGARDPADFVFGFGRRICPGRHFAEATLTIALASILHVFDVGPPLDADGAPIVVVPATTDGVLSYPADCRYTIKPRSKEAVSLIRAHSAVV